MVGILNLNEADNNIEVHGGMESAGRGREGLCARRRINLVDEMAVNERRDRAGKSERARAGEMVGTKGPDGRGPRAPDSVRTEDIQSRSMQAYFGF